MLSRADVPTALGKITLIEIKATAATGNAPLG